MDEHTASVTVTAGELDLLLHLLSIDALPVVLAAASRFDSVTARDTAFGAAHASLSVRGVLVDGVPRPDVVDLLSVLSRPSVQLAVRHYRHGGAVSRMCAARDRTGAVLALRGPDSYTLSALETIDPGVVFTVLGHATALDCGSLSVPTGPLTAALDSTDLPGMAGRLVALGCTTSDAAVFARALADHVSHAEIVTIAHLDGGRQRMGGPVTVVDTGRGRILGTSTTATDGVPWSTLGPGGDGRVRQAVRGLLAAAATEVAVEFT